MDKNYPQTINVQCGNFFQTGFRMSDFATLELSQAVAAMRILGITIKT
jgi:hypothetical protein